MKMRPEGRNTTPSGEVKIRLALRDKMDALKATQMRRIVFVAYLSFLPQGTLTTRNSLLALMKYPISLPFQETK